MKAHDDEGISPPLAPAGIAAPAKAAEVGIKVGQLVLENNKATEAVRRFAWP
jgi:hypothetical protein